ncbi:hypothetical protein BGZ76_007455 [Entomortierella beljakovae]|nr:hypothetical protein BGZ76_007455 [Entomortierella beljakovae]
MSFPQMSFPQMSFDQISFSNIEDSQLPEHIKAIAPFLTSSVVINLVMSGVHLMSGLLLGVVKYYQIHNSPSFTAHPYISTAHRAALMYGFASIQLAVVSLLSAWEESINVWASIATQIFFYQAVVMYAVHGLLRDTSNQLKVPHKMGSMTLSVWIIRLFMFLLIVAEVGGCGILFAGLGKTLYQLYTPSP